MGPSHEPGRKHARDTAGRYPRKARAPAQTASAMRFGAAQRDRAANLAPGCPRPNHPSVQRLPKTAAVGPGWALGTAARMGAIERNPAEPKAPVS